MTTITWDTHALITELKAAGFSEKQTETQVKVMSTALQSGLATKVDISTVRHDLKEMELRMTLRFGGMLAVSVTILAVLDKIWK